MSATFDPSRESEAATSASPQPTVMYPEPSEADTVVQGYQVCLWDAEGIAAMASGRIPRW